LAWQIGAAASEWEDATCPRTATTWFWLMSLVTTVPGLLGLGLVVLDESLDLLAEDAAGVVDLVEGHRRAVLRRDPEGRDAAGQRAVFPDRDLVRRSPPSAAKIGQNQGRRGGQSQ
jgi:hypothetical protein